MSSAGAAELASDGYRFVQPVEPAPGDFDAQGHLNNAAIVRLFNDMRVSYVRGHIGGWWLEEIAGRRYVIAAREVHVLYESEGRPDERFVGGMKYVRREGKAALLEQRIVTDDGRAVARMWAVQLLVQDGRVVAWPDRYFDAVATIEQRPIEARARRSSRVWGPPE